MKEERAREEDVGGENAKAKGRGNVFNLRKTRKNTKKCRADPNDERRSIGKQLKVHLLDQWTESNAAKAAG